MFQKLRYFLFKTKTAKWIKDIRTYAANQKLYKVYPPIKEDDKESNYVIVSKSHICIETYGFLADKNGGVTSWMELGMSKKGEHSHRERLSPPLVTK